MANQQMHRILNRRRLRNVDLDRLREDSTRDKNENKFSPWRDNKSNDRQYRTLLRLLSAIPVWMECDANGT